jgi:hypothetical protein
MSDIEFILSIPKACTRWRGNIKGLLDKRGGVKYAENLAPLPLREIYQMIPLSAKKILLDSPFKAIWYHIRLYMYITFYKKIYI